MRVLIAGGSGLIGTAIARRLLERGDLVTVIDRRRPQLGGVEFQRRDLVLGPLPSDLCSGFDAVVNLAGRPIRGRWTPAFKQQIWSSRVESTRSLVRLIAAANPPPALLVSASAVGYYGNRGDEPITEATPAGSDFLAKVCADWEAAAATAPPSCRVVVVRTAPVLESGGLLGRLARLTRWGFGSTFGAGRQGFPWIHLDDLVRVYLFALDTPGLRGAVNAAAPETVTNRQFSLTLARLLHRPALWRVPHRLVRMMYGEIADSLYASQFVRPERLAAAGFPFRFPQLESALQDILKTTPTPR
jgi:hypothetical protein